MSDTDDPFAPAAAAGIHRLAIPKLNEGTSLTQRPRQLARVDAGTRSALLQQLDTGHKTAAHGLTYP